MEIFGIVIKDTVNSVLADFNKAIERLNKVQQQQEEVVKQKAEEIRVLEHDKNTAQVEADRAKAVAIKIETLIS